MGWEDSGSWQGEKGLSQVPWLLDDAWSDTTTLLTAVAAHHCASFGQKAIGFWPTAFPCKECTTQCVLWSVVTFMVKMQQQEYILLVWVLHLYSHVFVHQLCLCSFSPVSVEVFPTVWLLESYEVEERKRHTIFYDCRQHKADQDRVLRLLTLQLAGTGEERMSTRNSALQEKLKLVSCMQGEASDTG